MKGTKTVVLSDQKKDQMYNWNKKTNTLEPIRMENDFLKEAIAWYQTADYLFVHKLLK